MAGAPLLDLRSRGSGGDGAFRGLAIGAAAIVLVVLGMIAMTMTQRAIPAVEHMGPGFFSSTRWSPADQEFGALPFVWGTLYTALIAVVLAVPVSLGVALFITQLAPPKLKKPLVYIVDLLAVIPSVVFGLWGILVLSPHLGRSFLTAGVILAIMITPIITSLAREVIETTPPSEKEAALALGATRWEMIGAAVWPHSKGGLVGAVMLGLGRAMGETIAAALVIGSALGQVTLHALAPGNSMPAVIANEWGEADELHKSALIALAVLLFAITIAVNLVASAIVRRSMARALRREAHVSLQPVTSVLDLRARPSWRATKNGIASGLMATAVLAVALPLVLVLASVIAKGAHVAFLSFPDFFTDTIPEVSRRDGPGMGPAILGTLLVTGVATLIAVPLGILGAVYLHEYGADSKFARLVRFMAMVMTGVPSVVMGLFVYLMWTMRFGYSAFGGALALACLMLPVVIGTTEQMLKLVPNQLREASFALGAGKARTILTVVLPAALPGIVSGALLAVARAAGETAPLMFAVGAATAYNPHVFENANTALSVQIFGNATSAFPAAQDRAWGAALTLVMLTFLVTLVARIVTARFASKK